MLNEPAKPNVVFEGGLPIRQVAQLHWFDDSIHDQSGAEACPQAQKEHFATLVTAKRLHDSVVHYLDRPFESCFEIKTRPALSQVPRLGYGAVVRNQTRIAYRDGVIVPLGQKFTQLGHHPFWRQS